MTITGRTAVVTGAASGIGREIAWQLAARGAHVLATDLDGTGIEDVARDRDRIEARVVDVTSRDDLEAAIEHVVARHGRLDLMFNNAGVAIFGEVDVLTLDDWDRIIDVNLRGVAHGTTLAYALMVRQGGGHIVNTASVAGLVPVPLQAHYCATKHAVVGLSRTLAVEAREHGVRVTAFCPGFVDTGMFVNNTIRGSMAGVDPRRLVPIRPLDAAVAVRRLLDGVERGDELVITPFYGRLGWWLERLSPAAAMRLHRLTLGQMRSRAARARRKVAA